MHSGTREVARHSHRDEPHFRTGTSASQDSGGQNRTAWDGWSTADPRTRSREKYSAKYKCEPGVDEANCCYTSRSLQILIGQHSKVTSSEQGCKPVLVKWLLYKSDVSIHIPTELASLACTLQYLQDVYWVPNTHTWENQICVAVNDAHWRKERERDQTSLYYTGHRMQKKAFTCTSKLNVHFSITTTLLPTTTHSDVRHRNNNYLVFAAQRKEERGAPDIYSFPSW